MCVNKRLLQRGSCMGPDHPGRTVFAAWDDVKQRWICGGDPQQGIAACAHGVVVHHAASVGLHITLGDGNGRSS